MYNYLMASTNVVKITWSNHDLIPLGANTQESQLILGVDVADTVTSLS